jgi:ABC-type glutathione transport system ATPase component
MRGPLLEIRGLEVAFGARRVVHGVDLRLAPGGSLAIVGESGSGKSMAISAMAGLLPPSARASGSMRFDGIDLSSGMDALRGRRIGFVFQDVLGALNPFMRVGTQVAEGIARHLPLGRSARRSRVEALLEEVGLSPATEHARRFPHQLSGGQRQRVAIAMAIACDPDLLVADEPTSALDVTVQARILDLLVALRRRRGLALVLVTHDLSVASRVCDRVAVMHAGAVVEEGALLEVFAAPRHHHARALLGARGRVARDAHEAVAGPPFAAEILGLGVSHAMGLGRAPVVAVRDASFSIGEGESVGLVGESGSGKSTLARALVGLARPATGSVRVFGEDPVATRDRRRFARRCQVVMQDPAGALNPRLRVLDAVAEPLVEHGLARGDELVERCAALLGEVGLEREHLRRFPHQLSGGQRQRVAIARAIALDPGLLVCDEPVSALDMTIQRQVLELLDRLRRDRGMAMLFISHDLDAVAQVCDRIIVMKDGSIVEVGATRQVIERPFAEYTRELVASAQAGGTVGSMPPGAAPG